MPDFLYLKNVYPLAGILTTTISTDKLIATIKETLFISFAFL